MASQPSLLPYDFSRCFLRWSSARVTHTPRCQIDAACRVTRAGSADEFFLTAPCAGEAMYAPGGLIHQPAYDFVMIYASRGEFFFNKRYADSTRNVAESHRVGDVMGTQDGKGAAMLEMSAHTARFQRVRELRGYAEIREAILANRVLVARTALASEDGSFTAEMDYPVRVCNVSNDSERWQIDAGPVLAPDFRAAAPSPGGGTAPVKAWPIDRMRTGYIVYNEWHWAEFAFHRVRAGGDANEGSAYSPTVRLDVRNQLFCVEA